MKHVIKIIAGTLVAVLILAAIWLALPSQTDQHDLYLPTVSARVLDTEPAAQPNTKLYLPAIHSQGYTGFVPKTEIIYTCQCGAVDASLAPDGNVLLAIQDHSRGGRLITGYDNGTKFVELSNAPMRIDTSPSAEFPGLKQGIGTIVFAWGHVITYAPNRTEPDGRYNITRAVSQYP